MAEDDTQTDETQAETVPVEKWIQHPVSDHADLARPAPVYADGLSANERAEFEQGVTEREARLKATEVTGEGEGGGDGSGSTPESGFQPPPVQQ